MIYEFSQEIATHIESEIDGFASVAVYPGVFSANELKRVSARCPAARVAIHDVQQAQPVSGGEVDVTCAVSVAVLAAAKAGAPRERIALELVDALLVLLAGGSRFGCDYAHPPTKVSATNHFSPQVSRDGIQLWEVRWQQAIRIGQPEDDGFALVTGYIGQAPEVGVDHVDDYTEVGQ